MTFKIGTRGSQLATTQSGHVQDWLAEHGYEAELTIVTTAGDVNMAPVERIGVGVFTQALREHLYAGHCDIAVHSFKDLPSAKDERFELIVPQREDPRDCLIARDGLTLEDLPEGAKVGTGAPRRISQLKAIRPDLDIRPLRGNITTRMAKVTDGELDAVVLAYAGLSRVDLGAKATQVLDTQKFIPAPAQGALAVECRADNPEVVAAIRAIADPQATACSAAERGVLIGLQAGCTAPVAAHSVYNADDTITLTAGVFALDGTSNVVVTESAAVAEAAELGLKVAEMLRAQGAGRILAAS